jgi:carbamoyl-phosphate synthase large subunit
MQTHTILVTGVGGRSVGHQVLHALSVCGGADRYRILTADADPFSFGLYLGHESFIVPRASDPAYVDALSSLAREQEVRAILPGAEPEVRVLAAHTDEFRKFGCHVLVNPLPVVDICSDKGVLDTWLTAHGFDTPRTLPVERWRELAGHVGFPLVGKPGRDTGGSRGVMLLCDETEALQYREHATAGSLVQEYVPDAEHEYTVGVLLTPDGSRVIDTIVLKRKLVGLSLGSARSMGERHYAISTGYSQGFIVDHPFISQRCAELALAIGAAGPLNIQCRHASDDIKVFEVHPRFSGTTSIRASVGFNEPDVLLRSLLFGETFQSVPHRTGVAVIRAFQHVVVPSEDYLGEIPAS